MSRQTTRLNLTVWDSNSDQFSPTQLAANWDSLEGKFPETGTVSVTSGTYTSSAVGGQTYYYKDATITFAGTYSTAPRVLLGGSNVIGVAAQLNAVTTTTATVRFWTLRNDAPAATAQWAAIIE